MIDPSRQPTSTPTPSLLEPPNRTLVCSYPNNATRIPRPGQAPAITQSITFGNDTQPAMDVHGYIYPWECPLQTNIFRERKEVCKSAA